MATMALTENYITTTKVQVSYKNQFANGRTRRVINGVRLYFNEEPTGKILYISRPDENGNIHISNKSKPNTIQTTVNAFKSNEHNVLQKYINFKHVTEEPKVYDIYKEGESYTLKPSEQDIHRNVTPEFVVNNYYRVRLGFNNVKALKNEKTNLYWLVEEHYRPYCYIKLKLMPAHELPIGIRHFSELNSNMKQVNADTEKNQYYLKRTGCIFPINRIFAHEAGIKIGQKLDIYVDERDEAIIIEPEAKICEVCGKEYSRRFTKMRKIHFCKECVEYADILSEMTQTHGSTITEMNKLLKNVLNDMNEILKEM